jgi:hypothetical protein
MDKDADYLMSEKKLDLAEKKLDLAMTRLNQIDEKPQQGMTYHPSDDEKLNIKIPPTKGSGHGVYQPPVDEKLTKKLNTKIHDVLDKIQKISFFLLVAALLGFLSGAYASYRFITMKMNESIQVGGIVFKGDVYNMVKRDVVVIKLEQKVDVKTIK